MNDVDRLFLLPTRVLDFTSERARALSTNLAHASEPGYRRVDVDFGELLEAARRGDVAKAKPHARIDADAPAGSNGNNVDFEREQVQIDKNSLLHELATFFVNAKLNALRAAIRGQGT